MTTHARGYGPSGTFALGVALALVPALGPVSAALLLIAHPFRPRRADLLWLGAALAFGITGLATGGWGGAALSFATIGGPWIVYRAFSGLRTADVRSDPGFRLALGLLTGFVIAVGLGLVRSILQLDVTTALTGLEAIVWRQSPAQLAHSALTVGGLIALLTRGHRTVSWSAMAVSAFAIMTTGSLDAVIAWVLLAGCLVALPGPDRDVPRRWPDAAIALGIIVIIGIVPTAFGWGMPGFPLAATTRSANLLAATEDPRGNAWDDRWVDVETATASLGGATLRAYEVDRKGPEPWLRLQQLVRLEPGGTYTLSAWIDTSASGVPGLHGWGMTSDDVPLAITTSGQGDAWSGRLSGPGRLIDTSVLAQEGPWRRVAATFDVNTGIEPFTLFVGFAPDARQGEGRPGRFAGLMLEEGVTASPYVPGVARSGLGFGYARAPLWRAAWEGAVERPLFGWGPDAYASFYTQSRPGVERQEFVPAHPHSLVLWVLFERGGVGLLGLGLLLVALFGPAVRMRDYGLLAVVGAVLIANVFDATFLSSAVLYPLAAIAGWRGAAVGPDRGSARTSARPVLARFALATVDLAVGVTALALGHLASGDAAVGRPLEHLAYLGLIWPAFVWREGLYPGYGLTAAQELKRQVLAWSQASATLLLIAALTRLGPGFTAFGFVVAFGLALVAMPVGRAGIKRALLAAGAWGRPVVVLGAGETGRRVVRALERTPLDGLHPIAVFDDDPNLGGARVGGVVVEGSLDDAATFARRNGVRHVVVAISHLDPARRARVLSHDAMPFQTVHYVPRLDSLPSYDVVAKELDGLLALESKVGLASRTNRAVKRAFDLAAVVAGGLVISPLLLTLAVAVRLDSRGPVLYGQTRIGRNGRRFKAWKFRSMRPDADAVLATYLEENPELRSEWETTHKLKDDPRVTRVGRLLRATSLDELPQLWNVLRGEMSLVGPRPIVDAEVAKYGDVFALYTLVRPGITGHWQVSGRSDTTYDERVAMDAHYVRNWSIWFDLVVLAKTASVVVRRDGAY